MTKNTPAQKAMDIKAFLNTPMAQKKIRELVNKNSASFVTSIMQVVNNNPLLINADPVSIFAAACMAVTLNLPINNNLGLAYIIPYNDTKSGGVKAQFQLGYKGLIQLAQRSGQFKRLVSFPVYKTQLVKKDLINGFEFDWSVEPEEKEEPIGFYAFFRLLNGFTAELYMSNKQMNEHAKRYSRSYRGKSGVWVDNYEQMALKTVTKLLLSRQAPLSIEMEKGITADQSIIKDINEDEFDYIDNPNASLDLAMPIDEKLMNTLVENIKTGEVEKNEILNNCNYQFTAEQREFIEGL